MKMVHCTNKVLLTLVVCFLGTAMLQAQPKIALVNLQKVFDGYWKTKQADTQLKDRQSEFRKQNQEFLDSYKKANEDYKKILESDNDQAVSADEREKRKKSAEDKLVEIKQIEAQINQFGSTADSQIRDQLRRVREKILDEIKEVAVTKAKAGNYTMVFDTAAQSANNTPVLVYSSGENDLTDEILRALNATAPVDLIKSPDDKEKPADSSPAKKDNKK